MTADAAYFRRKRRQAGVPERDFATSHRFVERGRQMLAMMEPHQPLRHDTGRCPCGSPHGSQYPTVRRSEHGRGFSSPVYHCSRQCADSE